MRTRQSCHARRHASPSQAPSNPSSHEFKDKAQAVATLPTELLVGALNEHVGLLSSWQGLLAHSTARLVA